MSNRNSRRPVVQIRAERSGSAPARPTNLVVSTAVGKKSGNGFSNSFSLSKYYEFAYSTLINSSFIIYFGVSLMLLINYHTSPNKSFIYSFSSTVAKSLNVDGSTACNCLILVVSALPFVSIVLSVQPVKRLLAIILCMLYYNFVPEKTHYEYLIHSIFIFLFLRTTNNSYKIASVLCLLVVYAAQFSLPFKPNKDFVCKATDIVKHVVKTVPIIPSSGDGK